MYVDPAGTIWVGGDSSAGPGFVASYNTAGIRNPGFGTDGVATTPTRVRGINAGPYTGWTAAGSANNEFAYDAYSTEFGPDHGLEREPAPASGAEGP